MRRVPILPTLLVAAAIATMIALGVWQLGRARQRDEAKLAMVARAALPAAEFPYADQANPAFVYRRFSAACDRVVGWETLGGQSSDGASGWRHIATCLSARSPAPFRVDVGVSSSPSVRPAWPGGAVAGLAKRGPDKRSLWERLRWKEVEPSLLLVADAPAPGLSPSQQPDPSAEENSSWSYAVQWFLFAAVGAAIYALALRKRLAAPDPRG